MSEEALQITETRRNAKGKGGMERYTHSDEEFQRIARRDEKAFLSDQCKEIEGNRMGKTRDLLKKIRDTKGTFHATMCTIEDRNGMDLTEAEEIKKRWQEYQVVCHSLLQWTSYCQTRIQRRIVQKRSSRPRSSQWYDHSSRARHPEM